MVKKILQDVIPVTRKIPVSKVMPSSYSATTTKTSTTPVSVRPPRPTQPQSARPAPEKSFQHFPRPKKSKRLGIWALGGVAILAIAITIYVITTFYDSATVTIVPRTDAIPFQSSFVACKDIACSDTSSLTYKVIQPSRDEIHVTVPATLGPVVQVSAKGAITLYNGMSSTSQRVPYNTHLLGSNGLSYHTLYTVTIPGAKKTQSGIVPGSMVVAIAADGAGEKFNIPLGSPNADFHVISHQNPPKYSSVYGHLASTSAITGGFIGAKRIVDSAVLAKAYTDMQDTARSDLLASAQSLVPQEYIMYPGAYSIDFTLLDPVATSTPGMADVGIRALFSGAMLKRNDLARLIATDGGVNLSQHYANNSFTLSGLDTATYRQASSTSSTGTAIPFSARIGTPLSFSLTGTLNITGDYPKNEIAKALAGLTIAQSKAVFARYGAITSAHAILSPFWLRAFPASPEKIHIQ